MKKILSTLPLLLLAISIFSQEDTRTIMTINGKNISAEEFKRVYTKNNNITPEAEKKSIDDYLDLFINFKLKVIEAENKGYDTMKAFVNEFDGYREQLAKPYIQHKEIKDSLVKESYYRTLNEVKASHIMVKLPENAPPADTLRAYNKIMALRDKIVAGEPFEKVATESSDDRSAKENGGNLGYFSAFRMVYPFECAAYNTPVGQVSMPIRTIYGYHLVKTTDLRQSKGSVKVAHIMTRFAPDAPAPEKKAAYDKIKKALDELNQGADWKDVVKKYSENKSTRKFNGEIGWLKTGQAPENFLDSCFKHQPGQHTGIIETQGGYHIAKILEIKPVGSFDELKDQIAKKMESDAGHNKTIEDIVYSNIKKKYGFEAFPENANALIKDIDSSVFEHTWSAKKAENLTDPLVKIGDTTYTVYDYAKFIQTKRFVKFQNISFEQMVKENLGEFEKKCLMAYAVKELPKENMEYKYLLKEYHDGILLFNLTNDVVWKRAQEDTTGLEAFYKTAKKYNWKPRAVTEIYEYSDSLLTPDIPPVAKKQAKGNEDAKFVNKNLCPNDSVPCIIISEKTYEKDVDSFADKLPWKKGKYISVKDKNKYYLYYVKRILPAGIKKLSDARGLYIADYQNYLEDEWVKQLRQKYTVNINQEVLSDLKSKLDKNNK